MSADSTIVSLRPRNWPAALACATLAVASCSSGSSGGAVPATLPNFSAAVFTDPSQVDNPFFPLVQGTAATFADVPNGSGEIIVIEVLDTTRTVMGLACAIVRDRVFEDGLLIEDTHDWYAQDDAGNVWYMGEEVDNYEYDADGNVIGVDHDGAWEAGLDVANTGTVASPGWIMEASPTPGDFYYQEFYPGLALDQGTVIALNVLITLSDGTQHTCLQIRDTSALSSGPGEDKFFASGIGLVLERNVVGSGANELRGRFEPGPDSVPDFGAAAFTQPAQIDNPFLPLAIETATTFLGRAGDETETIVVEVLDRTRVILGVTCRVVQDRVFVDGLLIEDTHDWFAQDDAGNVWYMGEAVDNYTYDDMGNLLTVDHEGSWEAGLDVSGTGEIAEPGHLMLASPSVGAAYHQEFYADEAQDMAVVVSLDASVELEDGTVVDDCLQVLEWSPLAPEALEYKYYAAGIGLVLEEALHEESRTERQGTFETGSDAIPDFGAAVFTNSTLIDNTFLPLEPEALFTYEGETDEGPETVVAEVLTTTRVVQGVTCRIVHVQAFLEGVIEEENFAWFAQDDDGNVWWMGEDTSDFVYDEGGVLVDVDTSGSWEAGLDVAGTGTLALPGHAMPSAPAVGDSYAQVFYADVVEDLAVVVASGVTVTLDNGAIYTGCMQTLEWDAIEADGLDSKFYAPGVGLVLEVDLVDGERLELDSVR